MLSFIKHSTELSHLLVYHVPLMILGAALLGGSVYLYRQIGYYTSGRDTK